MTALIAVTVVLALALAVVGMSHFLRRKELRGVGPDISASRILFPFLAHALSGRALQAALRLARAENATLVPVFLARVPLQLPLDTPLPRQFAVEIPMHEVIEQRAAVSASGSMRGSSEAVRLGMPFGAPSPTSALG